MSVNFTANLVHSTQIPHRISWRNYGDTNVSIIELDVNNDSDLNALKETSDNWLKQGGRYIHHIYEDAVGRHQYPDIEKEHFYALTTQNAQFEKVRPKGILGVVMFSETKNKENEINWLEVSPLTNKTRNKNREYKLVGTRLVDYLKDSFKSKDIFVQSASDARDFYRKAGFSKRSAAKKYQYVFHV